MELAQIVDTCICNETESREQSGEKLCWKCYANILDTQGRNIIGFADVFISLLTNIKLKSLVLKGVCAAPCLIMLLQNNHPFTSFGQKCCCCQTSYTATNDHSVQSRGDTVGTKT